MEEVSTPSLVSADQFHSVTDLLIRRVRKAPHKRAFLAPPESLTNLGCEGKQEWNPVTTAQFCGLVEAVARGLIVAEVQPGDAVAIWSPTRFEWAVADFACWYASAVVVPIYDTAAPAQVKAIVGDAQVRYALVASSKEASLMQPLLGKQAVWIMDEGGLVSLAGKGSHVTAAQLEQRRTLATLDEVASIVYTSGTTDNPKGVLISHRNFIHQVMSIAADYEQVVHEDGATIIFLPLAHVLARGLQLICITNGMTVSHLHEPTKVVPALGQLKPSFIVVVPRVLEKIAAAAAQAAREKHLSWWWNRAVATAVQWSRYLEDKQFNPHAHPGYWLQARHRFFDRLFYGQLLQKMGADLTHVLSGGAVLEENLCRFFWGAGLEVIEGYGLTETTAPLTANRSGNVVSGTVGTPVAGMTICLDQDGQVWARGDGVCAGYRSPLLF